MPLEIQQQDMKKTGEEIVKGNVGFVYFQRSVTKQTKVIER